MASNGKKKTTMAKLTRETKLRERRLDKQARKASRKLAPADRADQPIDSNAMTDVSAAEGVVPLAEDGRIAVLPAGALAGPAGAGEM